VHGKTFQEPLAADAGEDSALDASGSDGSDAGEDAGLAAIGGVVTIASGAGDGGGATSRLPHPASAVAHASAQRAAMRSMKAPLLNGAAIVRRATDRHCRPRPLSSAGHLRQSRRGGLPERTTSLA
jgi:hypothetical protein